MDNWGYNVDVKNSSRESRFLKSLATKKWSSVSAAQIKKHTVFETFELRRYLIKLAP